MGVVVKRFDPRAICQSLQIHLGLNKDNDMELELASNDAEPFGLLFQLSFTPFCDDGVPEAVPHRGTRLWPSQALLDIGGNYDSFIS